MRIHRQRKGRTTLAVQRVSIPALVLGAILLDAQRTAKRSGIYFEPITDQEIVDALRATYGYSRERIADGRRELEQAGMLRSRLRGNAFKYQVSAALDGAVRKVYGGQSAGR